MIPFVIIVYVLALIIWGVLTIKSQEQARV
jgi:hypothetical protein